MRSQQQEDEEPGEGASGSAWTSVVTTKHHLIGLSSSVRRNTNLAKLGRSNLGGLNTRAAGMGNQRHRNYLLASRARIRQAFQRGATKLTISSLNDSLFVLVLVLVLAASCARALNCYHCSSVDNPDCDEPFTGRANFTETNCERSIGVPAKVCRKIVQYIEHKKVVIRSCGYIDEHEENDRKAMCYKRSGTFAIMMESCNCYTDNCNHSASLVPNQSVLPLLTLLASLFILFKSVRDAS